MKLYKILDGLQSCHGGNHTWKLGEWVEVQGNLVPGSNGIHLCRPQDLIDWLYNDIYEAEYDGDLIECNNKLVVKKARIIKHCDTWNERTARLFACWCARQVVHLNNDPRTINAIEIAERFANGEASYSELDAARFSAKKALRDAIQIDASEVAWVSWIVTNSSAWLAARGSSKAIASASSAWLAARGSSKAIASASWNCYGLVTKDAKTKKLMEILEGIWP